MNLKEVCDYRFPATLADAVVKVDKKFSKSKFLKNFLKEIRAKKELKQIYELCSKKAMSQR